MNNTGYDHHNTIMKNRATGYEKKGNIYENAPYLDMSIPYAAGSLYSTVEDLYLWDQALYTEQLLPKKYMDKIFSPTFQHLVSITLMDGLLVRCLLVHTTDSLFTIGHGGGINGFNTLITRIPTDKSLIVLLNNTGGARLNKITTAIAGILHSKTYALPKQSLAYALLAEIEKNGISAGLDFYDKNKNSDLYALSQNEMNNIGYKLLQSDKLKDAEEVFKLNMAAFPESSNVYDSYAESLMLQGQNELAIENYKKSVELNPANQGGIEMLKKLGVETADLVKDATVPEDILASYVGKYELKPGFILTITKKGVN